LLFRFAGRADAFQNIVDTFHLETVGQVDNWRRYAFQTVGVLAFGTEEMRVLVVVAHSVVVMVVATGLVLYRAAAVVNFVNQMVLAEGGKASEDGAFIDGYQGIFQVAQAHCVFRVQQGFENQKARGSGFYVVQ